MPSGRTIGTSARRDLTIIGQLRSVTRPPAASMRRIADGRSEGATTRSRSS